MRCYEFLAKYCEPATYPLFDSDQTRPGIQLREGNEQQLIEDFKNLPFADKIEVTRQVAKGNSASDFFFIFENSPLKPFANRPDGPETALVSFQPLDALLAKPDHDLEEARWVILVTQLFQKYKLENFRNRMFYNLFVPPGERHQYETLKEEWEKRYQKTIDMRRNPPTEGKALVGNTPDDGILWLSLPGQPSFDNSRQGRRPSSPPHYRQTIRPREEAKSTPAIRGLSQYFDTDLDGVYDFEDYEPVNKNIRNSREDRDNDGIEDWYDLLPDSPEIVADPSAYPKPSPSNPYNIRVEKGPKGPRIIIEAVVGLAPSAENGVKPEDLAKLCLAYADRIKPYLESVIPEELRDHVRLSISFLPAITKADGEKAHRIVAVSRSEKGNDGLIATSTLWPHDLDGPSILHETGHRVFGLPDRYHQRVSRKIYRDTDRTTDPGYKAAVDKKDIMGPYTEEGGFKFTRKDLQRIIALGTRKYMPYFNRAAHVNVIHDELELFKATHRLEGKNAEDYLSAGLDILLRLTKMGNAFDVRLSDMFNNIIWHIINKSAEKAFVDLDEAIRIVEGAQRALESRGKMPGFINIKGCKELLEERYMYLFAARGIMNIGGQSLFLQIASKGIPGVTPGESVWKAELEKLQSELQPFDGPKKMTAVFETGESPPKVLALPKLSVTATYSSDQTVKFSVNPMYVHETGEAFQARVFSALSEAVAEKMMKDQWAKDHTAVRGPSRTGFLVLGAGLAVAITPNVNKYLRGDFLLGYNFVWDGFGFQPFLRLWTGENTDSFVGLGMTNDIYHDIIFAGASIALCIPLEGDNLPSPYYELELGLRRTIFSDRLGLSLRIGTGLSKELPFAASTMFNYNF